MKKWLSALVGSLGLTTALAFAQGPDDTFMCLDELSGPVIRVTGDQGYQNYDFFHLDDGARLDFRGAIFYGQNNPLLPDGSTVTYPVDIRVDSALDTYCVAGPTVIHTNDPLNTWLEDYNYNHVGVYMSGGLGIIDGARVHGTHDAFRANYATPVPLWEVRNSWVTYNRDDCIENDNFLNLLVDDSLFDGCYTFYSSRNVNTVPSSNVVTIQNSLIRMEAMPGPYRDWPSDELGHSGLFKIQADSPDIRLYNNIFLIEQLPTTQYELRSLSHALEMLSFGQMHLADCRKNIIVWTGPGDFPGDVPNSKSCVRITTDRTVWEDAVAEWKVNHPLVPRIAGIDEPDPDPDPEPDPEPEPDPVPGDTEAPTGVLDNLEEGMVVPRNKDFDIQFHAFDNDEVAVIMIVVLNPDSTKEVAYYNGPGPHQYKWRVPPQPNANYRIELEVTDRSGNIGSTAVNVVSSSSESGKKK